MFLKLGELVEISPYNIQSSSSIPDIDPSLLTEMTKYATELKRIAPKANDFLYFSAVMMHAAEVVLINKDGTPKMTRQGKALEAHWDVDANGSWKWVCNDPYVKPYCNANKDCFPEAELIKAYKQWIGKPLCVDHKSSSVEHTRGFIVDTYYDRNLKRVVALCALDKLNYPELARGVETGYKNSVSMGTGVSNAICYDCGRVAKAEADFCKHMQTKSGYCEINVGLNPLELSIVVNGADGDAKVKHIIAMVDTLNAYVDEKEKEIAKIASKYRATLSFDDGVGEHNGNISVAANDLSSLEQSIHKAITDFAAIAKEKSELDSNNAAYSMTGSTFVMPATENSGTDFSLAPPTVRFAMTDEQNKQLLEAMSSIDAKLAKISRDYEKLATTKHEDETMSGTKDNVKQGYFQGGGGVNEPTPGKTKYEIDPLSEDDRDNHDKQMVGQKPFPDVGPVDGMYPGYDSFPMGELERKKMLLRAEQEQRAIRRTAVIEKAKQAYFQNGEGANNPNTPTPHKVKYPIDPLEKDDRNNHDKQMVGQKPFPEVGSVDGLHPSPLSAAQKDELKRKELLQRAGLKARFTKAADLGASTWQIFGEDEKLLLSKTVDELTSGRTAELYAGVATEAFAKDLMSKIRTMGAEKVSALFKSAQVPPPSPMGDAPAVPVLPAGGADDAGKDGDPLDKVLELSDKVRDLGSDLAEAAHELKGEPAEMDMGSDSAPAAADDSSGSKMSTAALQNEIAAELSEKMLETAAALTEHENELKAVARLYESNAITATNKDYLTKEINETIAETEKTFATALELMGGYIKFATALELMGAKTVEQLNKRATREETMQPENKEIMGMLGETDASLRELASALEEGELTVQAKEDSSEDSSSADDLATMLADDFAADDSEDSSSADDSEDSSSADDNKAIMVPDVATAAAVAKEAPDASVEVKKASREERIALRAKLASEMDKINPIFNEFHPKGGETPSPLKSQDELAKVEDIEEKHEKIMDVLHATPKVKKQAAELNDLIKAGKISTDQVDQLASFGVDPAAVKYWKDFYGEMGPEGKTFATDLLKVNAEAKLEEEMGKYRVKLARAYELTYEMKDAGLVSDARDVITATVNEMMEMNDPAFESMKKVVAQHAPAMKRTASLPNVGSTDLFSEAAAPVQDLRAQLDAAFSNSKPRAF